MITQPLYFELCEDWVKPIVSNELKSFLTPYVLVIHRPSRRGFYLDREYRHIIDVSRCSAPEGSSEVEEHHLSACDNIPLWVLAEKSKEFTTYWLY